jgi:hypothetical protein
MKLLQKNQIRPSAPRLAFTLPEILISSTIFVAFITVGMIVVQLFGIRSGQLSATKMVASADSLRTLSQFRDQVRGAAAVQVGTFTSNTATFTAIGNGTNQTGNAVQVFPGTNTANYLVFYRNTSSTNTPHLYVYTVATNGTTSTQLLAQWVMNTNCFSAEDHTGTILTSGQNDCTIYMNLQFYEKEYVFYNNPTNYYYLETRATPRAPNIVN